MFKVISMASVLMISTLTSACAPKVYGNQDGRLDKKPAMLPYSFSVESFLDRRPGKGKPNLAEVLNPRQTYSFDQNQFLNSLVSSINGRTLFEYETATLRIELKDYAAFKDDSDYTTSFYVDITGFDEDGRVLATGVFSCFSKQDIRLHQISGLKRFLMHSQDKPTGAAKDSDAWDELYSACLNEVAYEFNAKVMEWHQRRSS